MTTVDAFAPAKINLTLHVTGRRDDGYHLLDSLVVFARDIGDRLSVASADRLLLSLSGQFTSGVPQGDENLVLRAARLLQMHREVTTGAAISLEKNLPNGAGLGGGSSDAAAAIHALARLWGVAPLTPHEVVDLGADLPVCLAAPTPQQMQGTGDVVSAVPPLPEVYLVLVNSGVAMPTGPVFARLQEKDRAGRPMAVFPARWDFEAFRRWLSGQRNDLTESASELTTDIPKVISALLGAGASGAGMSGSGATCWGLFRTGSEAQAAARAISGRQPDWWVRATAVAS